MEQIVFLNGTLLPRSRARISPFDHGFLYGYALFETMRAYSGHLFLLQKHLNRLTNSSRSIGLPPCGYDLEKACYDVLRVNNLENARIRLTVSMGEGEGSPDPPPHPEPTVLIAAMSYTAPSEDIYLDGFKAVVSSVRRSSHSPLSGIKSANYLENLLARKEADRGFVCEGSTSNVFIVKNNSLVTPDEQSGCLPGITREVVMETASAMGIAVEQREVQLKELVAADEAFLTNSLLGLMPLRKIDGKALAGGIRQPAESEITYGLTEAYRELICRETGGVP